MDDLQRALTLVEEQRDAQEQLRIEADAAAAAQEQLRIEADATAAQALLQLAQAQAAAASANAAAMAAGVAGAGHVTFASSPALASSTLLNYSSGEGIKIYGKATAPLDVPFGGDSGALRLFLSKVQHRAAQFGWSTILQINQDGAMFNFLETYGQVTLASIRTQAANNEVARNRDTQNSTQMYTFLITSVTDALLGKIISKKEDYTSSMGFQDGPSLLKVIITISHVDTRAQTGFIRQCLARLSITVLTPEYGCNIQKLNEHVVVLEEELTARGETSQDTMMNVHSAYLVCKDAEFVRHMKDKYARWEQGTNFTLKEYMESAGTKYQTLLMKGLWEAPSPEQEQIIALTAAMSLMKSKSGRTTEGKTSGTGKPKETAKGPRKNDGAFAWKDVGPKAGEPSKKTVKGRTYYWCTRHKQMQWTLHNPDSFPNLCKYHPKYAELEAAWKAGGKDGAAAATAEDIKLEAALAAIQESDSDSDDL